MASEYENELRRQFNQDIERLKGARERIGATTDITPEEMYKSIQASMSNSLSDEELKNPRAIMESTAKKSHGQVLGRTSPSPSPSRIEILKEIPVDEGRSVEIRYTPTNDTYEYAATKMEPATLSKYEIERNSRYDNIPRLPEKKDIAKLSVYPDGRVGFVSSGYTGAKEGAVDRLLMEATKHEMPPHSKNLLPAGKKMVARKAVDILETPKDKYLQKLQDFLVTGKSGKIWSTAAPIIKGAGMGLTALGALGHSDVAGAATDIATSPLGGVQEMGISPEQKELDNRYLQRIRELQSKGVK